MAEPCGSTLGKRAQLRKDQLAAALAALAGRQWGVVARWQLIQLGFSSAAITRARAAGRLDLVHPRVYAVGRPGLSTEGDLFAALLYAGPGAALGHVPAAWWRGLLQFQPRVIHVSTPRDIPTRRGIRTCAATTASPCPRSTSRSPVTRWTHSGETSAWSWNWTAAKPTAPHQPSPATEPRTWHSANPATVFAAIPAHRSRSAPRR